MIESPFDTISAVVRERSNAFDDLRIIARDHRGLSKAEKSLIEGAADELGGALRAHFLTWQQLAEVQQRLIATNDQLLAARRDIERLRKIPSIFPSLTLTITGVLAPLSPYHGELPR